MKNFILLFASILFYSNIDSKCIVWRHTCCDKDGNDIVIADLFDVANCNDDNARPGTCTGCPDSCWQLRTYHDVNGTPTILIDGGTMPRPMFAILSSYTPNKTIDVYFDPSNDLYYFQDRNTGEINNILDLNTVYMPTNAVVRIKRDDDLVKITISNGELNGSNSYVQEYTFNWKNICYDIGIIDNITPNPSSTGIVVGINNDFLSSHPTSLTAELFNANNSSGVLSITSSSLSISRGTLPSGTYYLIVKNGADIVASKVVVLL